MQLQFEDGVNLDIAQAETLAASAGSGCFGEYIVFLRIELDAFDCGFLSTNKHFHRRVAEEFVQVFAGVGAARRAADDLDHVVDVIKRDAVAEQNVFAFASLAQLVLRAAPDHVHAVLDEVLEQLDQAEFARLARHDSEQDHTERFLHLCVLVELVEDDLRLFVALHLDHDAHAFAIAFVANVADAFDLLVLNQLSDVFDQAGFIHLIGQLGDDDVLAVFAALLDGSFGTHLERSAAFFIGLLDAFAAIDVTASGKIRARNNLHHLLQRGFRIFDQQDGGFDRLAQVVRRDVRRHADGDAGRAVDQKIWNARGKNDRLFFAFIEIGREVDRLHFDIGEHFLGDFRKARFGVTHRRRWVAVDGAKVPLAVDQGVSHVEVLGEADESVVDGGVAVGVILAEDLADDLGALAVGLGRGEAQFVHAVEDAAVHGLEAVADVGQGPADDYAHRVIEVRLPHFRFDIDRRQYLLALLVCH